MSADNWAICPRCKKRHQAEVNRQVREADTAYGKVPVEEWKEMVGRANAIDRPLEESTFREDYEIYGAEDGVLIINYHGQCSVCGLSLTFKHEQPIEGIDQ